MYDLLFICQPGSSVPVIACQDCTCANQIDPKSGLLKIICVFQQCKEHCELVRDNKAVIFTYTIHPSLFSFGGFSVSLARLGFTS